MYRRAIGFTRPAMAFIGPASRMEAIGDHIKMKTVRSLSF
jgi:hypothetical protein